MLPPVFGRVPLVEKMPVAVPETQTIGVIQRAFRTYKVIQRTVLVCRQTLSRLSEALHQGVILYLGLLFFKRLAKSEFRDSRYVGWLISLAESGGELQQTQDRNDDNRCR
jgi:hypothetical protein